MNAYCSLADIKAALKITDGSQDTNLEDIGTGACRALDKWLGTRFYAATETRLYTPGDNGRLWLDMDLLTVTSLKTDEDGDRTYEVTWSSSLDYYLGPANATSDGLPYMWVERDEVNGRYWFPCRQRSVQLVGSWGYCATGSVPAPIKRAVLLLVGRLFKRDDAPLGVAGSAELGFIRLGQDRDIQQLVEMYDSKRRMT